MIIQSPSILSPSYSPLTELSLGGWWDSDPATMFQDTLFATPVTANGQALKGWKDKSGLGRHFSDATGMVYQSAGLNSRPTGKATGASGHKLRASFVLPQPFHLFFVVREHIAASAGNETMVDGNGHGNAARIFDNNAALFQQAVATGGSVSNAAGFMRLEALFNGATSQISRDAGTEQIVTTGAPIADAGGLNLNVFGDGSAGPGNYEYAEIVLFTAVKDVSAISRLLAYFKVKYNL